jgi:GH15 family glucan-1,4-alpha-glucosidase
MFMPRDLPIGNGTLLVNFDNHYNVRDIYFPFVGQENHSSGHVSHTGIWIDGRFAWLEDDQWERSLLYESDTLVTSVTMHHPELQVTLHFSDAVDFAQPIFVRQITVTNNDEQGREIRLFFHYGWHIENTDGANTVYYDPTQQSLIAYKNHRYFLMGGATDQHTCITDWATGKKEFDQLQGTWIDAEDGTLGKNPIDQGSVDCTFGLHIGTVEPHASATAYHWLCAGYQLSDISELHQQVLKAQAGSFLEHTRNYWKLWINKSAESFELPQSISELYKRSLLIIATQIDANGAIIASTDDDMWQYSRDSYNYMWPRDGALVAAALSHSGYGESTRGFFDFCTRVIEQDGYFFQKYTPHGAVGSSWVPWVGNDGQPQLPIQEDETALVIYSLWQHYTVFKDVEFVTPLYQSLIKPAADFMAAYRDPQTKLLKPSWDLWEERRGIHTFTIAAVHAGLTAATKFAALFGDNERTTAYRAAADELYEATRRYLWDDDYQRFARRIIIHEDGSLERDMTCDMAISGLFQFEMFHPDDPQLQATMKSLIDRLQLKTEIGGYARYENDYYHRVSHDIENVPGNPWFICSCWVTQWQIICAQTHEELQAAQSSLQWIVDHALASGILSEQIHPYSGQPLSASPLTWSHSAFIETVRWYLGKWKQLKLQAGEKLHDQAVVQSFLQESLGVQSELMKH